MLGGVASSSATPNTCPIWEAANAERLRRADKLRRRRPPHATNVDDPERGAVLIDECQGRGVVARRDLRRRRRAGKAGDGRFVRRDDGDRRLLRLRESRRKGQQREGDSGDEQEARAAASGSKFAIAIVVPPPHRRLLRRLHGRAGAIGEVRDRPRRTAGSAGGDLGRTTADAIRRPDVVAGAGSHAFAADVHLAVRARNSGQRKWADRGGRIYARLDGGTAASPVELHRQTCDSGPDCAAACVPCGHWQE